MNFLVLILASAFTYVIYAQDELLQNPDFEEPFDGTNNWWCNNCQLEKSTDAYTGQQSAQITNRVANWAGLSQYIPVQPNRKYYFRAMVKYLNQMPGALFEQFDLLIDIDFSDDTKQYLFFSRLPHMELAHGWQVIGGDFELGAKAIRQARLYFQTVNADYNYVVDSASLIEIIENPNWLSEANNRIEQIRKADITFNVNINSIYNPADISLEVSLSRHAFPFGTAINCDRMSGTDDVSRRYQDFFFTNFEMATIENALKWRQMEWNQGEINFERPRKAINALVERGVPVRGHCVYWEVEQFVPEWLKSMNGDEIRAQLARRAQYVVDAFKGNLTHWDVNNEDLHGTFFKEKTGDTSIINSMFSEVQRHDADCKLFLNEYHIVNEGTHAHAYLNQANRVKNSGSPIYGVGVQSHHKNTLSPAVIQKRMSVIEEAGLPIWITELDYPSTDENVRADAYEMALRLYYSDANIEGVILWGFWDGAHYNPDCAFVNGDNFELNEAGRRFQQLVKGEWHTSATLQPTSSSEDLFLRGFQGEYVVNVKNKGNLLKTINFTVPNKATSHRVQVDI